jgi:hypothetical protein
MLPAIVWNGARHQHGIAPAIGRNTHLREEFQSWARGPPTAGDAQLLEAASGAIGQNSG